MGVIIREARISDIPEIAALEELCFSLPWTAQALREQIQSDSHVFLVAERDGVLAGYAGLQYVLDEGYITNVAAAPAFRRQGIASAIMTEMLLWAKKLELAFLTLEVRESNSHARRLYEKHGFREVGKRRSYYENPVEDAMLMTVYLK
ncbi:MAG TPA: ribosomal-protein-alanine N-acetyltransferase [Clostridiales bacterium]|nr:ribosomal-protein-alanine N-acetyltransferase [Clostridiales bacterium]